MTPRPGTSSPWPIRVWGWARVMLEYRGLDMRLRLRIRARRCEKGVLLSPVRHDDTEAIKWIEAQAAKRGIVRWTPRQGWVKEKSKTDPGVG